jgi:prevent-host-death family protein
MEGVVVVGHGRDSTASAMVAASVRMARTQFGQIMDLATKNDERFIVDRRGKPAVVIMSVQDFIRTAAPPPN